MASFCATGNNRFFLTDDSGNRRWLPFYVNHIDDPFRTVLPYAGLYAQAVSLYRSGFRFWFTDAEVHELNNYNKEFEEPNIEEELICQYFRTPNKDEKGSFMSVAEIMERIGATIKYNLSKSKINRAMDKLGYVRSHSGNLRGFQVIAFTPDELANRKQVTSINNPQEQPLLPF